MQPKRNSRRCGNLVAIGVIAAVAGMCGIATGEETGRVPVKVYYMPEQSTRLIVERAQRAVLDSFIAKPDNSNVDLRSFAGLIVAAIPTLLVFILAQGVIMRGITIPVER